MELLVKEKNQRKENGALGYNTEKYLQWDAYFHVIFPITGKEISEVESYESCFDKIRMSVHYSATKEHDWIHVW